IALKLTDYSRPSLQISDLVMTDQQDCSEGLRRFTPNLRESFKDEHSQVGAYFELYSAGRDSITVEYSLSTANGKKAGRRRYTVPGGVTAQCLQLNELITQPGEYLLSVQATAGAVRVKGERSFFVHWSSVQMQTHEKSADLELEQLALIVRGNDLDKIRAATGSEQQRLLAEFWRQRDPTPGTEVNELREEFYRRIDFAVKNFTVAGLGQIGWKSDRGRVLVRNGTPDEIERHATEPGMPAVEIWEYRRLNKRFIFTDRQGSGDFRLVKVE
nr:GWxTD domain-containing protein [bacterium]